MAITFRPDDPPKQQKQNSWMEEESPSFEQGTKDPNIPEGNLQYSNALLSRFQEQPYGVQTTSLAEQFRQKYGPRAEELQQRLNEHRKPGQKIDWQAPLPISIQNEPVNVNGQKVDLGAGGRYVKQENAIYMGPRYVKPEPYRPAYKDQWSNTISHEMVHPQQDPSYMKIQTPPQYTTTHQRDPRRFDEVVAQIMGDELNAYNLRQPDDRKFHPMLHKNAQGEYDYEGGMQEFYRIMRENPELFVNANRMLGKEDLGAFDPKTKGNVSGKWKEATQTIGGNVVSRGDRYEIQSETA